MNDQTGLVNTLSTIARKYGLWIIVGLMALEIVLARRRGEL